jgi:hypothetical protein
MPSAASWRRRQSPRPPVEAPRLSPTRSPRPIHFHPRLKNIIALFKENEQFRQTRGLIELVSRLLRSFWDRQANDVFLIGPQHFDLSIPEVREKLTEISGFRDVIAKDLWDSQQSAHAQIIDLQTGKEAATQIGALLLTASLPTAVNAVKGLTREEMVECLVSPLRGALGLPGRLRRLRAGRLVPASHRRGPLVLRPPREPDQSSANPGARCPGEPGR